MSDDLVCVGTLGGAFGVQGDLRLKSFCAEPSAIADYNPLRLEGGTEIQLTLLAPIADALKGAKLYARRDQLPALPDDEYYYADLTGLEVVDTGGAVLGRVKSVQNHGAGDLLEVQSPALKNTVLVPFTQEVVPTVDLTAGRIVADPPIGLAHTVARPSVPRSNRVS